MVVLRLTNVPLRGIRILKLGPTVIQTASIMGRGTRGGPLTLPKPFPYESQQLSWIRAKFDSTMVKVSQENAKIIAVEGPISVGKTAFCKALAEEFDMHHIPQPTMDWYYILPSGYDLRQHDHQFSAKLQSYDHKNFCVNPKHMNTGRFQIAMMSLRFRQYLDAMCHLLNTGQGVILERNFYSDYVFMKAMYENEFISKAVHDTYMEILSNTSVFFPSPHLIIYLDIPVAVVQERIRTRNFSYEQNSPALTNKYLKSLEKFWKQDYLKSAEYVKAFYFILTDVCEEVIIEKTVTAYEKLSSSEILVYDWTDGGDVDVVVDDIEKLDFNIMRDDKRFIEWWYPRKDLLNLRLTLTNEPDAYEKYFDYPYYLVDELYIPLEEQYKYSKVLATIPECKYDKGYNHFMGDSIFNILFKFNVENHRHHKKHLFYDEATD